jgi:hypothetical protein
MLVAASAAGAQLQPRTDDRLPLTDRAPPEASGEGGLPCGDVEVHGIAEPGEGPEQAGPADLSRSSAVIGCPTLFRAPSLGAFNVTREATAHLVVGCDQPTAMHQPLDNVRLWLVRSGDRIAEGGASLPAVCSPGDPMELEVTVPQPEEPGYNASDTVGLDVTVFGSPNLAVDNLHLVVGGNETASALTLPGVGEAFVASEPETDRPSANATNETALEQQSTTDEKSGIPAPGAGLLAALGLAAWIGRRRA